MENPAITIVLSTYNRPDTLRVAIQSVQLQTYPAWTLLVIGDCCDSCTEEAVETFNDDRIRYINLPVRSGEQSGPNSVGIALAETEYIAFLNHDDVWLKDHLEYSLRTLRQSGADFFVGKSAFASKSIAVSQDQQKPIFDELHRDDRHPKQSICGFASTRTQLIMFEPVSIWLIRTETVQKVGYWKGRDQVLGMAPILEWVRRAWKQNVRFVFGTQLSVLTITTQYQPMYLTEKGAYSHISQEHAYIYPLVERLPPDDLRQMIFDEIKTAQKRKSVRIKQLVHKVFEKIRTNPLAAFRKIITKSIHSVLNILLTPLSRWLFYKFEIDLPRFLFRIIYRLLGRNHDVELVSVVKRRTGETLNKKYDIDTIVHLTLAMLRSGISLDEGTERRQQNR